MKTVILRQDSYNDDNIAKVNVYQRYLLLFILSNDGEYYPGYLVWDLFLQNNNLLEIWDHFHDCHSSATLLSGVSNDNSTWKL